MISAVMADCQYGKHNIFIDSYYKDKEVASTVFFALFFYYPSAVNEHNADISALTFMFLIFYLNKGI